MEQEMFERILAHTADGSYQDEVKNARTEYFIQLKDLREDDPSFERLMSCFLNWYVFDRPMQDDGLTPIQLFAKNTDLSPEDRFLLASMAGNIHSLFEIIRLQGSGLQVKDLFTNEIIWVTERRKLSGLAQKDILEARLLPIREKLIFAKGAFVLHPKESRKYILNTIKRCRQTGKPSAQTIIHRLQALCFRYNDRYQQRIPIERVYMEIDNLM